MNWTRFKETHLFSVNLAVVAGMILWQVRRDFYFHPLILVWFFSGIFFPGLRTLEKIVLRTLGKVNGFILLTAFYFLAFTPFSFFYRWFFRHKSFRKLNSTFEEKLSVSAFDRPF